MTLHQKYLNIVYHNTKGHAVHNRDQEITETYGEILYSSMEKLISHITITKHDIFYDLGSGLGKVVAQMFLTSAVRQAIGIEIIPELHQQALVAAKRMQDDLPKLFAEREMNFLLGNFLDVDFRTATIVLLGSPCFSPKMLHTLALVINNTPSIHTILTLRPFFNLKHFIFKKAVRVECSWDTALCYLYEKEVNK